jgi:DNA-binding NarL/FixJ family response regulator
VNLVPDLLDQPSRFADAGTHGRSPNGATANGELLVPRQVVDDAAARHSSLPLIPLGAVLDTIDHGIVLLRSDAHPCYRNAAAESLLGADSERALLSREIRSVSRAALGGRGNEEKPTEVEVGTRAGWYRMRATLLTEKIREISARAVMVTIHRAEPRLPSPEFLMRRFSMTTREADVALLLARGASNATVASELRISQHTARHHTENVLAKLNVHTRREVASAIVAGTPSDEASAHTRNGKSARASGSHPKVK